MATNSDLHERAPATFDVAIVGAGSAGCALAGRLAARAGVRIALVEAGPDYGPRTGGQWPADLTDAHHTPDSHDWGLEQARARVVGGCSVHNEAALVRALPGDYDRWATPGWSDADLAPLVADIERAVPTRVSRDDELAAWQRAFLDTALDLGFPQLADVNDAPGDTGVAPFTQNIQAGVRWNAAFAFLDPVRDRVTVIDDVLADRLLIEGDRAHALIGDQGREIRAERFVLCAGVFGSPAILLRSGLGPAEHLERLEIPVVADLPGVGANLHDHPGVRDNAAEYSHPAGTCRMGSDAHVVVDSRCRVHGLANVFVADASVIPQIPRANINLTCYVIGARAADVLAHGSR